MDTCRFGARTPNALKEFTVSICERYLPKGFCQKCRRVASACLCVTAFGAHDVPHTHQENAPTPAPRMAVAAVSTSAGSTLATSIVLGNGQRVTWSSSS